MRYAVATGSLGTHFCGGILSTQLYQFYFILISLFALPSYLHCSWLCLLSRRLSQVISLLVFLGVGLRSCLFSPFFCLGGQTQSCKQMGKHIIYE